MFDSYLQVHLSILLPVPQKKLLNVSECQKMLVNQDILRRLLLC